MSKLFDDASLAMIPSAYKDGKLYSIRPIPEYGSEVVTNGTFNSDLSGWTINNAGAGNIVEWSSGEARLKRIVSAATELRQDSLTIGKQYYLRVDVRMIGDALGAAIEYNGSQRFTLKNGVNSLKFTATATLFGFICLSNTTEYYIDNVSVKEVLVDDGDFTFSRGSNLAATRVDVNGLIEKGRENLITYSNDFNQWNIQNVAVTSNAVSNPFNTGTTQTITEQVGTSTQYRVYSTSYTASSGTMYTHSVYVKRLTGTRDFAIIDVNVGARVYFDMTNIAVGTELIGKGKIEDVGNGWYRLSVYGLATGSSGFYLALCDGSTASSETYNADGSGSYALYGAQLEKGLVATDYIETGASTAQAGILEDMPRLDYSGSCPALLLEPQRTNMIIHSEYFDAWNQNAVDLDFGYLAPDGTYSAYKVTDNTGQNNASLYLGAGLYGGITRSIWARTTSGTGEVDLMTYFENTNNTFTITEEWQRFDILDTTTAVGLGNFYAVDFRGGGLNEVILWGAQAEVGSYPTSYIPTYGSSVTRSWDDNTASFADIESEGTMFGEVEVIDTGAFGTPMALSINDATTNFVLVYKSNINKLSARIRFGGVDQCLIDSGTLTEGYHKFAFRYRENDCEFFVDGVSVGTDTIVSIPTGLNTIRQYIGSSTNPFVGGTKQLAYFPTALTDSECIALTTL